ncbi:3-isopropylmalate/(R)-2-methylmalate dehydratase small subunit [Litoreibacter meonggei]|jgi:3-isopropylmalate/(R)-2-methylmalate dehydratase small subunit|uniref:3-isopropylmalate dehydratase n=1 Tax=Litoreibacter meonggei TaxID=1049199 RepID=A0A497W535_9RHOB|nr:3-isopropylmalate dehydratase small subunit [Litoreibacter meonggei]RLJ51561.1 3-isopropylmalate/(R)-2-methylmalate dehydratase small subunit [Litoreibacter meonggei]
MPKTIKGHAAPLPLANVDTDVIMPKRFLITITREGLADGTFADLRFDDAGAPRPDFILNQTPWNKATILIVGDNFGCGSSREHAVWGMAQLGFTAAIGTGFAGIFYDNARKNGLALPIVTPEVRDQLMTLAADPDGGEFCINIETRTITASNITVPFQIDGATQNALIRGGDDTLDTLEYAETIRAFEAGLTDKMRVRVIK